MVLTLINNGNLTPQDFLTWREACHLTEDGRRRFFAAYEQRKATVVTHPVFGYKMSYRRMFEVQARHVAGTLAGAAFTKAVAVSDGTDRITFTFHGEGFGQELEVRANGDPVAGTEITAGGLTVSDADDLTVTWPDGSRAVLHAMLGSWFVELEVPGFEQQELTVEVTDHALIVRGEHEATREEDQDRAFHLRERVERRFERRFGLPDEVDVAAAAADYRNGVLTVRMPKREGSKPRVVDIAGS